MSTYPPRPPGARRKQGPWTEDDDAVLAMLFNEDGLIIRDIATRMDRAIGTIRARLARLRKRGLVGTRQPGSKRWLFTPTGGA